MVPAMGFDPFFDDPLYGHPWQSPAAATAKRRARHKARLDSLTARDWARIRALARQVSPGYGPARLDDLDAPGIAVGVCMSGDEWHFSGERVGSLRGGAVALLVWATGREA